MPNLFGLWHMGRAVSTKSVRRLLHLCFKKDRGKIVYKKVQYILYLKALNEKEKTFWQFSALVLGGKIFEYKACFDNFYTASIISGIFSFKTDTDYW